MKTVKESEKKPKAGKGGVYPPNPGPGRPKGIPNKFTTLKQAFLDAFEATGGAQGLIDWVKESKRNRAVFYQLLTKLFPQEVKLPGEIKVTLSLSDFKKSMNEASRD